MNFISGNVISKSQSLRFRLYLSKCERSITTNKFHHDGIAL